MTMYFSKSLNTYFDSNVTPLDQIPADAIVEGSEEFTAQRNADNTIEETPVVEEVKEEVQTNSTKSKKG